MAGSNKVLAGIFILSLLIGLGPSALAVGEEQVNWMNWDISSLLDGFLGRTLLLAAVGVIVIVAFLLCSLISGRFGKRPEAARSTDGQEAPPQQSRPSSSHSANIGEEQHQSSASSPNSADQILCPHCCASNWAVRTRCTACGRVMRK